MDSPTLYCLTPVKNESWILDRFIRCAETWADHIVIADQFSDDGSRDIALRHPKVTLVDNDSAAYDEGARVNLLMRTARSIPAAGKRIFISLDADEALSANWSTSSTEWNAVLNATPGTVIGFDWVNVLPGYKEAFIPEGVKWFGYVDDGVNFEPSVIHSPRLPWSSDSPSLVLKDIKALHFQYTDWSRMRSKQRWYQAWERIRFPKKRAVTLFRQYNHMMAIPEKLKGHFRDEWFEAYENAGIEMRAITPQDYYWWDVDVLDMMAEHGTKRFSRLAIWDVDWNVIAKLAGRSDLDGRLNDPRSDFEKRILHWLLLTQIDQYRPATRLIQKLLQPFGW
ncbi:MAG: glycosyltransferase family 2 protein [Rhodothermales bacterium]